MSYSQTIPRRCTSVPCNVCLESWQRVCAVWDDARRHLHPPSLLQVGGGGGVARRGSVFLAVTLIRCCVGTCTESGWAFTSPVLTHFLLEKLWVLFPPPPAPLAAQLLSPGRKEESMFAQPEGEGIAPARGGRQARAAKIQPWLCVELLSAALTRARPAEAWFPSAPFASVLSSPGKTQRSV